MKNTNSKNYDLALLAELAYGQFHLIDFTDVDQLRRLITGKKIKDVKIPGGAQCELSETQAEYFIDNFEIVSHQADTGSGYSGTVFRRKHRQEGEPEYIFTNRGTETKRNTENFWSFSGQYKFWSGLLTDVSADVGDITFNGMAWEQAMDMFNYYQRLITPAGENVLQVRLDREATKKMCETMGVEIVCRVLTGAYTISDRGKIKNLLVIESIKNDKPLLDHGLKSSDILDVSGHSLGGHLSLLFNRMFPNNVNQVTSINGAGVREKGVLDASGWIKTGFVDLFFDKMGMSLSKFDFSNVQVIHGDKGWDFIARDDGILAQKGSYTGLYIEKLMGNLFGHGSSQMVDSLAVYDLLLNLDASKNTHDMDKNTAKDLLEMFKSASITGENTLETVVQHLYKMMTGGKTISIKVDDRESLHSAIKQVQDSKAYQDSIGQLTFSSLIDHLVDVEHFSASAVKEKIRTYIYSDNSQRGLAYRYALVNGLPFVLEGFDYSMLNQKGELNFYNAKLSCKKGSLGQLTKEYIEERLNYLVTMLENNINDSVYSPTFGGATKFKDENGIIHFDRVRSERDLIIFDSNAKGIIKVEGNNGKVFAGGGEDHITISGSGNYIEGGMDLDTYNVIKGHHHVINDIDGLGKILSNGLNLHSDEAKYNPPSPYYNSGHWTDKKGRIFAKNQYDLVVSDPEQSLSFTVKDYFLKFKPKGGWVSGLGIKLEVPKMAEHLFADCTCDPLVLDLNGNGFIDTIKNNQYSGAMFDYEGDGIRKSTNWLDKGDGFVFVDVNGDGIVNNGTELLSEFYRKRDGSLAKHGMEALADLDTNGDGKVDNQDQAYSKIKVWMDLNGDGISSENEIFTLESLGIVALNTGYKEVNQQLNWGDKIRQTGSFVKSDGSTGVMADINFKVNPVDTVFTEEIELTEEQESLVNLGGIRNLRSLQEAALTI